MAEELPPMTVDVCKGQCCQCRGLPTQLGYFKIAYRRLSNWYWLSTSYGSQQSNCFSTQLGDFDGFRAKKHQNSGYWVYDYLIKIGLLWSCLSRAKKPVCCRLVLWSFGNTGEGLCANAWATVMIPLDCQINRRCPVTWKNVEKKENQMQKEERWA